jgi:hypothetical protein
VSARLWRRVNPFAYLSVRSHDEPFTSHELGLSWEADAYASLPWNQGVATMKLSASAGEAKGPTNLPECLFLKVVPSTHSCSSR